MRAIAILLAAIPLLAQAQKYTGPRPAKTDVPYLLHADKLVETDSGSAQEQDRKDDHFVTVAGASAQARTPMAEPIFVIAAEKIQPDKLAMWRMEPKGGSRTLSIPKKPRRDSPRPIRLMATKLDGNLYKVEAQEFAENGEYCLSPEGSSQVFCFVVY